MIETHCTDSLLVLDSVERAMNVAVDDCDWRTMVSCVVAFQALMFDFTRFVEMASDGEAKTA